jgi:hypothetical protein
MFAAALASQKVGSKKWNELVTAIRAAKAEEEAWLSTTPEGRAEQFAKVYSKVMDVFNAQEAVLEMNNKAATAVNRKLIESLEKQIEVYNRRANELQRDLEKIAEKEDEINKAYDEKTKALEKVKKLNQDIISQQKSQLSIADALSRGDISAAASAVEDSRAQFAASQGDATQRGFDAQRDAQLNALTENGKTRAQIEAEIKQIKKDISVIEFGALQNARDAVERADELTKAAKENLKVQGKTKTEWENINTRIDASKANAALYETEVAKALLNAQGLVGEWSKLQDTFTTTHVVNTVYNGTPTAITPASTTNNSAAAAAALRKLQSGGNLTNAERTLLGMAPVAAASGGYISGPGTPTSDSIPAMLSDGEYVIKAASVNKFGQRFLDAINAGKLPGFRLGGMIRDGGGSSKSTPAKPIARMTADTAERRALAAKPTPAPAKSALQTALPMIMPLVQQMMDPTGSMTAGREMGKALVNLVGGKAGGGDYMALGLGALGFIPGGKAVSTGAKVANVASAVGRTKPIEILPINQISSMYSKEFGKAGNVTTNYWVDKGLMSQKTLDQLRASIARDGITTPLRVDNVRGMDVLVDGHHRLAIAKELGIKNIPIQRFGKGGMVKSYAKGGLATNKFAMGGLVSPKYFAMGGLVSPKYFADGGMAQGTDTVPAMLTPGEFVVNKKATDMYGPLLAAMNSSPAANLSMMGSKTFSEPVYNMPSREYADVGGNVGIYSSSNNSPSLTALDNSVYNYSLSVNVEGTNASANDIANVVMNKIKTIDSQQLRRQVLR